MLSHSGSGEGAGEGQEGLSTEVKGREGLRTVTEPLQSQEGAAEPPAAPGVSQTTESD
jgi:hypothetical protein